MKSIPIWLKKTLSFGIPSVQRSEWAVVAVLPVMSFGMIVALVAGGAVGDWTVPAAWALALPFVIGGSLIHLFVFRAVVQSAKNGNRSKWAVAFSGWAFGMRWLLLAGPLFIAGFNPDVFSLPTVVAAVLIPPVLFLVLGASSAFRWTSSRARHDTPTG